MLEKHPILRVLLVTVLSASILYSMMWAADFIRPHLIPIDPAKSAITPFEERMMESVKRLTEEGAFDSAALSLRSLKVNAPGSDWERRARLALAEGLRRAGQPLEALHTLQEGTWPDTPFEMADIREFELELHWAILHDGGGMLLSGAIPAINAEDSRYSGSQDMWRARRESFNALLAFQQETLAAKGAGGGVGKPPAPVSHLLLANYAYGGEEWEKTERILAESGFDDALRVQAASLLLQEHDIETAFRVAAPVWEGGTGSEEGALLFRRFRLWQARRRAVAEVLPLWGYPEIDRRLDELSEAYPAVAAEVAAEIGGDGEFAAFVAAKKAQRDLDGENVPLDFELGGDHGWYKYKSRFGIDYEFLYVDHYDDFSIKPLKQEFKSHEVTWLKMETIHRGAHAVRVYRLADRAHWDRLRASPSRALLPDTPVLSQGHVFPEMEEVGGTIKWRLGLPPLPEGFYAVTLTGRASPVVGLAGFVVHDMDMKLVTGESSLLAWVVNRRDGGARRREPVHVRVTLLDDPEEVGGETFAKASRLWQSGFREGFTGTRDPVLSLGRRDQDFKDGFAAGKEALARAEPLPSWEGTARTDAQGRAFFDLPEGFHRRHYKAVARIARPQAAVRCRVFHIPEGGAWRGRMVAWADKPLVRPGETIRYKALLRDFDGESFRLPVGEVRVRMWIDDTVILDRMHAVGETGAVHGEATLAPAAKDGNLELGIDEGRRVRIGKVRAIQTRPVSVEVQASPATVRGGEVVPLSLRLRDGAGMPMQGVGVRVRLSAWEAGRTLPVESPEVAMTDPEGGVHFPIPTHPGREATYLASIEMEGEGQLPLRRIIWKTESFPFPLEVDLQQGMVSPDGLLAFRLRCPEGASVRAELQDEGGTRLGEPFLVEGEGEAWTRAQLPVPKGVSEAVNLVLQPAGMPDDGEAMRVFRLTVRPAPEVDRDAELFLAVPDPEVEAGQPLPLILATTMPGRDALLLGGTRILRHSEVVRLQDALTTASVTAAPDWAPNLHLMALAYKPGEGFIQTGRSRVDVVAVHKRLRVEVLLEREAYRPGDTVRARVRVTDWKGAPVPNASVSLAVVNEDAHILESDPTPPLWKHFYNHSRHWTLRLGKRETLPAIEATLWKSLIRRWGFVDRRARLPSRSGRGRGRFLSRECGHHVYTPPMLDIPNERDNTVFWAADLRTDASGTAHVEFDLPQTRARFRATARAHDDSAAPLLGEGRTMLDVAGR